MCLPMLVEKHTFDIETWNTLGNSSSPLRGLRQLQGWLKHSQVDSRPESVRNSHWSLPNSCRWLGSTQPMTGPSMAKNCQRSSEGAENARQEHQESVHPSHGTMLTGAGQLDQGIRQIHECMLWPRHHNAPEDYQGILLWHQWPSTNQFGPWERKTSRIDNTSRPWPLHFQIFCFTHMTRHSKILWSPPCKYSTPHTPRISSSLCWYP